MTGLPKDPARLAAAKALLRRRAVARLVHGREPVLRRDLIGMVAQQYGLTAGAAEAAVDRAVAAGEIACWITRSPTSGQEGGPDMGRVLADLQDQAAGLEQARRALGEADRGRAGACEPRGGA